ncbi:GRIP and coiled-coil domain-containing protein 2-like [Littorina saxatilis]|uniref:GRIP and coiled-coil domain-containing protein 2-like n=1 Tax=Littorina saxatilis TaxID=31220 RepID=UPI0038B66B14
MMDLEMADYERTVHSLNNQLADRDSQIADLTSEVSRAEERVHLLQTQIESVDESRAQAEERGNKLKQLLVKTKKDLADLRKQESEQKSVDLELRGQMEGLNQQVEDYKVQMGELGSTNQRLQEKLRSLSDSHQRTIRSLESRVTALTDDLEVTRTELKAVHAEYDSYKVRAHSVLSKQKTRSPADTVSDMEKLERQRLESAVQQLKTKLQEVTEKMSAMQQDNEAQQDEHERLIQRYNKMLRDTEERDNAFKKRLEEVSQDKMAVMTKLEEKAAQLQLQLDVQKEAYKDQLESAREEERSKVEMLQMQLDLTQTENTRLQREVNSLQRALRSKESAAPEERRSPPGFYPVMPSPEGERQEGEGSEIVDPEPVTKTTTPHKVPPVSFEKLLTTPLEELPGGVIPTVVDEEELKANLNTAHKKIEHLTELLNESEESVSRMTEQIKVLKEEIRRLYRNQQREDDLQNLEYLKNILIKFLTRKEGDERIALIPVLNMMLKLNPDEKAQLEAIATGDEAAPNQAQQAAGGWGSYLHRWSGLN